MASLFSKTGASAQPAAIDGELILQSDTRRPMRIGLWVLGLGFGGFLLWAGFAPLDEGVPTQGAVSIDTKRKAVQHLSGGLVREILVREGQMVEAGQVLVRMDTAMPRANFESVRQQYMGLSAMESRLVAEQRGVQTIEFQADVLRSSDPMVQQQIATQRALFVSRRSALDAELRGINESIQGTEAMIAGYEGQMLSSRQQLALLQEELNGIRDLVNEGYAPRSRQMELERNVAAINGNIVELQGNVNRSRRSIAELQQRVMQRQQEFKKDSDGQLAQIRIELQALREKFNAFTEELGRTELRSPAAGQVVGLTVQTVGAVIQPAQKLMDIVPSNESLLLETKVPPHLIDRVKVKQKVDVRFSAFAHSPSLVVEGQLESISHDLVTEPTPQGNMSFYLARISVTPAGLEVLGDRQMQPGMPAEVIIKTGERSLLTYLLSPLTKRVASSMKEE
jgi:protease secretion system membrane fusion protein